MNMLLYIWLQYVNMNCIPLKKGEKDLLLVLFNECLGQGAFTFITFVKMPRLQCCYHVITMLLLFYYDVIPTDCSQSS